jgi:hypothetical protein
MTISVHVLTYHHINPHAGDIVTVTPEVFAAQMDYLADSGFTTLSIDELMKFLRSGEATCNKAVVITFDDGWLDNYLYAVPVLKRLNFKASFFIKPAGLMPLPKVLPIPCLMCRFMKRPKPALRLVKRLESFSIGIWSGVLERTGFSVSIRIRSLIADVLSLPEQT